VLKPAAQLAGREPALSPGTLAAQEKHTTDPVYVGVVGVIDTADLSCPVGRRLLLQIPPIRVHDMSGTRHEPLCGAKRAESAHTSY
jgi:hypothetical protein